MINKTQCLFYEVGGQFFKSLEEAQKADIIKLIPDQFPKEVEGQDFKESIARWLLANSAEIVNILTTTPTSRRKGPRKPRSDIGKKRTPKDAAPAAT